MTRDWIALANTPQTRISFAQSARKDKVSVSLSILRNTIREKISDGQSWSMNYRVAANINLSMETRCPSVVTNSRVFSLACAMLWQSIRVWTPTALAHARALFSLFSPIFAFFLYFIFVLPIPAHVLFVGTADDENALSVDENYCKLGTSTGFEKLWMWGKSWSKTFIYFFIFYLFNDLKNIYETLYKTYSIFFIFSFFTKIELNNKKAIKIRECKWKKIRLFNSFYFHW